MRPPHRNPARSPLAATRRPHPPEGFGRQSGPTKYWAPDPAEALLNTSTLSTQRTSPGILLTVERKHVGALPCAVDRTCGAEVARRCHFFRSGDAKKVTHAVDKTAAMSHSASGCVPKDFRIAKMPAAEIEHRIARRISSSSLPGRCCRPPADSELGLGLAVAGINGDQRRPAGQAQIGCCCRYRRRRYPKKSCSDRPLAIATGSSRQCSKSLLRACPQLMCPQRSPRGLY